jgi:hypothetical protein
VGPSRIVVRDCEHEDDTGEHAFDAKRFEHSEAGLEQRVTKRFEQSRRIVEAERVLANLVRSH